jgi:hypothetical protein
MGPGSCPTVAIKGTPTDGNPSGVTIINESDFDAETMTKCDMPEPTEPVVVDPVVVEDDKEPAKVVAPWAAK